ncbi:MAG: hypothetical protein ABH889_02455 [Candidatus Portnoybacteria bacterium]
MGKSKKKSQKGEEKEQKEGKDEIRVFLKIAKKAVFIKTAQSCWF